jgi:hypothetical protein
MPRETVLQGYSSAIPNAMGTYTYDVPRGIGLGLDYVRLVNESPGGQNGVVTRIAIRSFWGEPFPVAVAYDEVLDRADRRTLGRWLDAGKAFEPSVLKLAFPFPGPVPPPPPVNFIIACVTVESELVIDNLNIKLPGGARHQIIVHQLYGSVPWSVTFWWFE